MILAFSIPKQGLVLMEQNPTTKEGYNLQILKIHQKMKRYLINTMNRYQSFSTFND